MSTTRPTRDEHRNKLEEQLCRSAARFSEAAGSRLVESRYLEFAAAAATAVEHLAKALLCKLVDPAAIAEAKEFDSLLKLIGLEHLGDRTRRPRTIAAPEALDRCRRVMPKLQTHIKELHALIEVRNGVLHLGSGEDVFAHEVVRSYVWFVKESAVLLGRPAEFFLGSHADAFTALGEQVLTELEKRIKSRVFAARDRFRTRYGALTPEQLTQVVQLLRPRLTVSADRDHPVTCPACTHEGLTACAVELNLQHDEDGAWNDVVLFPVHFVCGVCELELDGVDELQAAGVPTEIEGEPEGIFNRDDFEYDAWREDQMIEDIWRE